MAYPFIGGSPNGGPMPSPGPTMIVIHDIECPLESGYARSLAGWFASGAAGTSCHYIVDCDETIQMVDENVIAWHCGTGNTRTIGIEQAGYARFSRAEWLTDAGRRQHSRVAALIADLCARWGIPLRWLEDAGDIAAAHRGDRSRGGVVTHRRIGEVLGGTNHWDPGHSYPHDLVMAAAGGGAAPIQGDGFLMALSDADQAHLKQQVFNNGGGIDDIKAGVVELVEVVKSLKADLAWAHARNMETQDPTTFMLANSSKAEPWRYIENGALQPGGLSTAEANRLGRLGVRVVKAEQEDFDGYLADAAKGEGVA